MRSESSTGGRRQRQARRQLSRVPPARRRSDRADVRADRGIARSVTDHARRSGSRSGRSLPDRERRDRRAPRARARAPHRRRDPGRPSCHRRRAARSRDLREPPRECLEVHRHTRARMHRGRRAPRRCRTRVFVRDNGVGFDPLTPSGCSRRSSVSTAPSPRAPESAWPRSSGSSSATAAGSGPRATLAPEPRSSSRYRIDRNGRALARQNATTSDVDTVSRSARAAADSNTRAFE